MEDTKGKVETAVASSSEVMVKIEMNLCEKAAATAVTHTLRSLLLSVHDVLSVAAAIVLLPDVRGSARLPAGGEAAAWPLALVRLQAAVLREDVVLQHVLRQALQALRTPHPGAGGFGSNVGGAVGP